MVQMPELLGLICFVQPCSISVKLKFLFIREKKNMLNFVSIFAFMHIFNIVDIATNLYTTNKDLT